MRFAVGLLLALFVCHATGAAAAPKLLFEVKGLEQPESVVQDAATGAIYVSNIVGAVMQKDGNGYIAKLKPDGTISTKQWVKGLNAPTGMALSDRTLYVADVDELVEINVASGELIKRYPAKGAIFLNDVAVGADGTVYVSDTPMNTIWRLKDGSFEPWFANDVLNGPNGLLVLDGKLIVASFGKLPGEGQKQEPGGLLAVDIEKQAVSTIGSNDEIGNLDGLQLLQPNVHLVTDWAAGGLYRIDVKGRVERLIKLGKGSADFVYFPDAKLALIPIMLSNSLVAYTLE
jgi:DNA-binding beta-propeller fold protein YncE